MSTHIPSEHEVSIRPAHRDDLPRVAPLAAELVRLHHALDARRFLLVEPLEQGYERFFAHEIDDPKVVLLVAVEPGGAIVGYVYGRLEPRDWNALRDACGAVHDVHVAASARGAGIGAKLMEAAIAKLEALGAPRVVLSTAWQNAPAQELFAKLGFRPTMIEMTRERGG